MSLKSTKINKKKITQFQKKIFEFYKHNKRDLPWRKTTNPYHILLSEVMLQQTQVSRGISYYPKWVSQWPTIHDLAKADRKDILLMWLGLGYNSRAINLHETAKIISDTFKGDIKKAIGETKLPGIGPYTKNAILIFAFNENIVTIDTNIRRIFIHEFNLKENISSEQLGQIASLCLPKKKSCDWHNALMDYGALHATAKKTGIKPLTKQGTFKGSNREIRAALLRAIVTIGTTNKKAIMEKFNIDELRIDTIIKKMCKENLIKIHNKKIVLK